MSTEKTSRRTFLKIAGAGLAGTALGSTASSYARIVGANDRVGVGIIGFSDRTRQALTPSFLKHADQLNFQLVAVSDIWNRRRDEGVAYIQKLTARLRPWHATTRSSTPAKKLML